VDDNFTHDTEHTDAAFKFDFIDPDSEHNGILQQSRQGNNETGHVTCKAKETEERY
jgi:hypothetical protein